MAKPIIFSTEMIHAIFDGKTQTRRIIRPPFEVHENGYLTRRIGNERFCPYPCPYVRETWLYDSVDDKVYYKADMRHCEDYDPSNCRWKPSIHMFKCLGS